MRLAAVLVTKVIYRKYCFVLYTKSLQKASYLLAYKWKTFTSGAWVWVFMMLHDNTSCFHYHSLLYNCPDVHRKSEDEWKTYSYHLTQFPLAFWYSTLFDALKKPAPAIYCTDSTDNLSLTAMTINIILHRPNVLW